MAMKQASLSDILAYKVKRGITILIDGVIITFYN